jgi:hypothetical protein
LDREYFHGISIDEPFPSQHRSVFTVDSLCKITSELAGLPRDIRFLANTYGKSIVDMHTYVNEVNPPILVTTTYPLTDERWHPVLYTSTGGCQVWPTPNRHDAINLQRAFQFQMILNGHWPGLAAYASVADSAGIQWMNFIQAHEEFRWNGSYWKHWWRARFPPRIRN